MAQPQDFVSPRRSFQPLTVVSFQQSHRHSHATRASRGRDSETAVAGSSQVPHPCPRVGSRVLSPVAEQNAS
jgi:hypothetical protein